MSSAMQQASPCEQQEKSKKTFFTDLVSIIRDVAHVHNSVVLLPALERLRTGEMSLFARFPRPGWRSRGQLACEPAVCPTYLEVGPLGTPLACLCLAGLHHMQDALLGRRLPAPRRVLVRGQKIRAGARARAQPGHNGLHHVRSSDLLRPGILRLAA